MLLPRAHASALSALLLAALLLGVTAPVSAEDAAGADVGSRSATVVFPDVRGINPDRDEYVVAVTDNDYDRLRASWQGHRTELALDGPTVIGLPVDAKSVVRVEGCVKRSCTEIARSQRLVVLRALHASWGRTVRVAEGKVVARATIDGPFPAREGSVAWEVLGPDPSAAPLASGQTGYEARRLTEGSRLTFHPVIPAGLPEGEHALRARLSHSSTTYGDLEGEVSGTVVVDRTAPVIGSLSLSRDTVYPPRDEYQDTTTIKVSGPADVAGGSYVAEDAAGEVVARGGLGKRPGKRLWVTSWRGERNGRSLPTGDYLVRATLVDQAGNWSAPVETTVSVVAQRMAERKIDLRLRPTDVEIDRDVGRCARVKSPSSRRVPGSIGLFSGLRCDKADQEHAVTANGVYLPPSAGGRYEKVQLRVRGGRSKRHRNGALPYLVVHLEDRKGRLVERTQLGSRYKEWRLDEVGDDVVHDRKTDRPYIIWHVGLTQGSRYDVDEYRVRGRYRELVDVATD